MRLLKYADDVAMLIHIYTSEALINIRGSYHQLALDDLVRMFNDKSLEHNIAKTGKLCCVGRGRAGTRKGPIMGLALVIVVILKKTDSRLIC